MVDSEEEVGLICIFILFLVGGGGGKSGGGGLVLNLNFGEISQNVPT